MENRWRFIIIPAKETWWTERDGPASSLCDELKTIGHTDVYICWYQVDMGEEENNVVRLKES